MVFDRCGRERPGGSGLREQLFRERLLGVVVELLDFVGEHPLVDRLVPVVEGIELPEDAWAEIRAAAQGVGLDEAQIDEAVEG